MLNWMGGLLIPKQMCAYDIVEHIGLTFIITITYKTIWMYCWLLLYFILGIIKQLYIIQSNINNIFKLKVWNLFYLKKLRYWHRPIQQIFNLINKAQKVHKQMNMFVLLQEPCSKK